MMAIHVQVYRLRRRWLIWFAALAMAAGGLFSFACLPSQRIRTTEADVRPELAAWAERVCAIGEVFGDTMRELEDDIDPSTLTVGENIERWDRLKPPVVEAHREAESAYRAMSPPVEAREYHAALVNFYGEYAGALAEVDLSDAKTAEDIDAAGSAAEKVRHAEGWPVATAVARADPAVVEALGAVGGCLHRDFLR